jgi:hypothetical protein
LWVVWHRWISTLRRVLFREVTGVQNRAFLAGKGMAVLQAVRKRL